MDFILECDEGLEDVVLDELGERGLAGTVGPAPGRVVAESPTPAPLLRLATVRHVVDTRRVEEVGSLDDVRRAAAGAEFPELEGARSFRVTSRALGDLPFEKLALQGAVGAALVRRYATAVDLSGHEVEVRADVFGRRLHLGRQHTRESLDGRVRRGGRIRSSLRPTVAAAMLRLAGAHRGMGRLLDPMCGAGVIPVEASRNPDLEVHASDWDAETVAAACETFRNHGLDLEAVRRDARSLRVEDVGRFDHVVSDPPHGLRLGRRTSLGGLYETLLRASAGVLTDGGHIVWIVVRERLLAEAAERAGLRVVRHLPIGPEAMRRHVLVLARTAR